jgi:subtilisin family serine protease
MTSSRHLTMPWSRNVKLYSAPTSLVLKLVLGEAPEHIPAALDVRFGAVHAGNKMDGGPIDRLIRHHAGHVQISRVHAAASALGRLGNRHQGYSSDEHLFGLSRTFRIDTNLGCCIADLVDALRQLGTVESVTPQYLTTQPFSILARTEAKTDLQPEDRLEQAWRSREQIRVAEAMAYEPGDPAVVLAIIDSGVALDHPELRNRLRSGFDTVQLGNGDFAPGIQLLGDDMDVDDVPQDEVGHGTSCAAIIGAKGQQIPPGLAGECGLLPVRVLGAARFPGREDAQGVGALSDIDAGLKLAIDLGAKVLNLSFGTPVASLEPHDPLPHADVVRYGLARGCVMVAASGNSGRAEAYSPAVLDGVIAVGSVDADGRPSSFTTSGDHVAVCAPGERIVSAGLEGGYQVASGTSFAAPFVAATAALLVSRAQRRAYPLEAKAVRRIICDSAKPWNGRQPQGFGTGVLDSYSALKRLDSEIDGRAPPI